MFRLRHEQPFVSEVEGLPAALTISVALQWGRILPDGMYHRKAIFDSSRFANEKRSIPFQSPEARQGRRGDKFITDLKSSCYKMFNK